MKVFALVLSCVAIGIGITNLREIRKVETSSESPASKPTQARAYCKKDAAGNITATYPPYPVGSAVICFDLPQVQAPASGPSK